MMYLWYNNIQDDVLCYGVPVMLFQGIVLKKGAYELCIQGMGIKLYSTCGKLLHKILQRCMPEDTSEAAENIKEMMAVQDNSFDILWYITKVVAKMMDAHMVSARPTYRGSLSRHTGAWDVYRMMLHHRSTIFKGQDCSVVFLRDTNDPQSAATAQVGLGILTNLIISGLTKDPNRVMPTWYEVRTMSAQIIENSPEYAIEEKDLAGVPTRLLANTLNQRRLAHDYDHRDQGDQ